MRRSPVILIACLVAFSLFACHKETDEDKVRNVVNRVQKASEDKDIKKILTSLSKTYRDPQGNDYDTIKGLLLGYFFRHQKIHVYIPSIDVAVEEGTATAQFDAVLTGGGAPGTEAPLLPESLGMYRFDVKMKKEEGEWKVVSAKWERTGSGQPGATQ